MLTRLYEVLKTGEDYSKFYHENIDEIVEFVLNYDGYKTDLYVSNLTSHLDNIRFSAVFSDLTNIYLDMEKSGQVHIFKKTRPISVTPEILKIIKSNHSLPVLLPGTASRPTEEILGFAKQVDPLISSKRLLIHNPRIIASLETETSKKPSPIIFYVSPNSASKNWLAAEFSKAYNSTTIVNSSTKNTEDLFRVTLPYFRNIDFMTLNKILNDHNDLLSSFRFSIKKLLNEIDKEKPTLKDFRNDVIRPQIDTINRKFLKVKNTHKLKIGVTLGTVTLSLIAISPLAIAQGLSVLIGGLGLLAKHEMDYQKQIDDLMDKPLYLLWKIKSKQ